MGIKKETSMKIKAAFEAGYNTAEIAKCFGLPESVVRSICHR